MLGGTKHLCRRRGAALVLAILFVAAVSTLAVAFATIASNNIHETRNERGMHRAQAAAESGLEYVKNVLSWQDGGVVPTADNFATVLTALKEKPLGTTTTPLRDDSGNAIDITSAAFKKIGGSTFKVQFTQKTGPGYYIRATVTGQDDSVPGSLNPMTRTVAADFLAKVNYPDYFDNGVYAKGTITMGGQANIFSKKAADGKTTLYPLIDSVTGAVVIDPATGLPKDGAALRSGSSLNPAIKQSGNNAPDGGFWVTGATTDYVQATGYKGDNYTLNYDPPHMPEFDPTVFSDLAPTAYASNSANIYTNVRIPANLNPTLSGTFQGIVYVESPNNVTFSGAILNCTVVVADKDNAGNDMTPGANTLNFSTSVTGGRIPDDLLAIREAVGGYGILAPTMHMNIGGSGGGGKEMFQLYGSIICNSLKWSGQSDINLINGSIIVLSESILEDALTLTGNGTVTMWKDENFVKPLYGLYDDSFVSRGYRMVANSYSEGP